MAQKSARFHELVKRSGKPQPVTLWTKPEENGPFMKAVRENRVLTVSQAPTGTKKDFGQVGFHQKPYASYFVFPRRLPTNSDLRVVGIKYEEIEQPRAKARPKTKAPRAIKKLARKSAPENKTFEVVIRRVAAVEMTERVTAADFHDAEARALELIKTEEFDLRNAKLTTRSKRSKKRELTNSDLAELLAVEAESASRTLQRALRRAGRAAFSWPMEAAELVRQGRSLTELAGIGPFLERLLKKWIANPPAKNPVADIRRNFFTWCEAQGIIQKHPNWKAALRGDLQMHTEWSDGSGTIRAMAEAAQPRGYEYIAITDHSKALKIAGGINETELEEQGVEIAELNREFAKTGNAFRVLRSIEMNLDTRGAGDMPAKALAKLDFVLGAFHSALRRTDDQTERYLGAVRNPQLHILGHPRGRIFNFRVGLKADWPKVFALAAKLDKAVEIDSYPDRQDLDVGLLEAARESGVRISLGTDAHHPWQLGFIDFGLAAAITARIPIDRILNFMTAEALLEWVAGLRSKV